MTHDRTPRVLITGAAGPAAISFMHLAGPHIEFAAADVDPTAAGLDMVPDDRQVILPQGYGQDFVDAIRSACRALSIDYLVPLVDAELLVLADVRDDLAADGVELIFSPARAVELCLDRTLLARVLDAEATPVH